MAYRCGVARRIRDLGRQLGEIMDELRVVGLDGEPQEEVDTAQDAANAIDDALDAVDSAIRTLESEDGDGDGAPIITDLHGTPATARQIREHLVCKHDIITRDLDDTLLETVHDEAPPELEHLCQHPTCDKPVVRTVRGKHLCGGHGDEYESFMEGQ